MNWQFHMFQTEANRVWGWGYHDDKYIWEYLGSWNPAEGTLDIEWKLHTSDNLVKAISKANAVSVFQRTMDGMERAIPGYRNKLDGNFMFAQILMKAPEVAEA